MSPPGPNDGVPDEEFEDPTPTPIQVPLPGMGATPIDWARYDVAVAKTDIARETIRRNHMGSRLGRRIDELERNDLKLRDFQLRTEGEDGKNGRLSNIRGEIAAVRETLGGLKRFGWGVLMIAIGALGTALLLAFNAGETTGTARLRLEQVEQRASSNHAALEQLKNEVLRLRFPSAFQPAPGDTP